MRLTGNFEKISKKNSEFFFSIFSFLRAFVVSSCRKSGFRVFLRLRYGADLGRYRLVHCFHLAFSDRNISLLGTCLSYVQKHPFSPLTCDIFFQLRPCRVKCEVMELTHWLKILLSYLGTPHAV